MYMINLILGDLINLILGLIYILYMKHSETHFYDYVVRIWSYHSFYKSFAYGFVWNFDPNMRYTNHKINKQSNVGFFV